MIRKNLSLVKIYNHLKNRTIISLICFLLSQLTFSQYKYQKFDLDKSKLQETSGIEIFKKGFLTHNDSGNKPILYKIDSEGKIKQIFNFSNLNNFDWEDLAQDGKNIYIADIGNNFGNRKNLIIHKLNKKEFKITGNIKISYKYQNNFKSNYMNEFDAEAITSYGNNLLLFSKNRLRQTSEVYLIPKTATEISLNSVMELNVKGLITSADYNKKMKLLVLSGYSMNNIEQFLYVYRNFDVTNENNIMEILKLPKEFNHSQIESVKIISKNEIILTSEAENEGNPYLLKMTFDDNYLYNKAD